MLALGSLMTAGGAGVIAGSVALAVNHRTANVWVPTLVLRALVVGGAATFVALGHRRRLASRKWEAVGSALMIVGMQRHERFDQ